MFCFEDVIHCISNVNVTCMNFTPEQLKQLNATNNFSVMHVNIWSPNKHHNNLTALLHDTGCPFNIIAFSETWLNDKSYIDILKLDGYSLYHKNRTDRNCGGVCLYVHSSTQANICDDLVINDSHTNSLFIEINNKTNRNLIVGVAYCHNITNIHNIKLESGVLFSNITDHFPIVLFLNLALSRLPLSHPVQSRVLNEKTLQQLNASLVAKDWDIIYNCTNLNTA